VAGAGELSVPIVIVVVAIGAFLGENTSYLIGRRTVTVPLIDSLAKARVPSGSTGPRGQLNHRGGELRPQTRYRCVADTPDSVKGQLRRAAAPRGCGGCSCSSPYEEVGRAGEATIPPREAARGDSELATPRRSA
jgi:hypothetical protein